MQSYFLVCLPQSSSLPLLCFGCEITPEVCHPCSQNRIDRAWCKLQRAARCSQCQQYYFILNHYVIHYHMHASFTTWTHCRAECVFLFMHTCHESTLPIILRLQQLMLCLVEINVVVMGNIIKHARPQPLRHVNVFQWQRMHTYYNIVYDHHIDLYQTRHQLI